MPNYLAYCQTKEIIAPPSWTKALKNNTSHFKFFFYPYTQRNSNIWTNPSYSTWKILLMNEGSREEMVEALTLLLSKLCLPSPNCMKKHAQPPCKFYIQAWMAKIQWTIRYKKCCKKIIVGLLNLMLNDLYLMLCQKHFFL